MACSIAFSLGKIPKSVYRSLYVSHNHLDASLGCLWSENAVLSAR